MAYWLLKTEPSDYGADDLERDGTTRWTGVANALALKHLRAIRPGDEVLIYHTGDERACVAIAEITSEPADGAVDVRFARRLRTPVTLKQIKSDDALKAWDLVRLGRLSVVPTDAATWRRVLAMAK